jgi:hypothetical protein
VTAVLNKNTDGPTGFGEVASDRGLRQVTQKLLVALIENEVNSALIFVAVARAAYLAMGTQPYRRQKRFAPKRVNSLATDAGMPIR